MSAIVPPICNREQPEDRFHLMLLIIAIVLLLFWAGGLVFRVAGGLIHIILVIALIVFAIHFLRGV